MLHAWNSKDVHGGRFFALMFIAFFPHSFSLAMFLLFITYYEYSCSIFVASFNERVAFVLVLCMFECCWILVLIDISQSGSSDDKLNWVEEAELGMT